MLRKQNSTFVTSFISEAGEKLENNDYFAYVELERYACYVIADGLSDLQASQSANLATSRRLSNGDDKYFNMQVEGVTVTESGVIAAYHLVGQSTTNDAFNGVIPWEKAKDGNEVPATTYMEEMGGLDLSVLFGGIE